jgi:solute:Na+ symporter, SSS family
LAGDPFGIDNMYIALITPPIIIFIERLFHWGEDAPLTTKRAALS